MIDVIWALNKLMVAPQFEGAIEVQIRNNDGTFREATLNELQAQYAALRWKDGRAKPSWATIIAYTDNHVLQGPLLERLTSVVNTLGAEIQAQFGGVIAPVYVALVNGRSDVGRLIIQNAQVPTKMEPVRQTLLAEFDK